MLLIVLGALRGARRDHFGVLGTPLGVILGSWGGLWRPFWGLGRFRRAVVAKDAPTLSLDPRFDRFWCPK